MFRPNKNIKIFFNYILGPLLGIWLFYSLYQQVNNQPHFQQSLSLIKQAPFGRDGWKFSIVILFTFFNWGLEARKWQVLMKHLQPLKFMVAFKSVLSGITLSLNTPNRIGEYGGRILFVDEGKRLKAISLSIAGSMAQLIVTLSIGCGGIIFLLHKVDDTLMGLSIFWWRTLFIISGSSTLLLLLFFIRLSWFIKFLEKIPAIWKYVQHISVLDEFTPKLFFRVLFLSLLRYIVFVLQNVFLLQALQVNVNFMEGFWVMTILFLMMAIVPSFAIADLGIRGKFSVELLSLYSANIIGILGAAFGIWLINLFLPALAGSLLIISKKYFKEK